MLAFTKKLPYICIRERSESGDFKLKKMVLIRAVRNTIVRTYVGVDAKERLRDLL